MLQRRRAVGFDRSCLMLLGAKGKQGGNSRLSDSLGSRTHTHFSAQTKPNQTKPNETNTQTDAYLSVFRFGPFQFAFATFLFYEGGKTGDPVAAGLVGIAVCIAALASVPCFWERLRTAMVKPPHRKA